MRVKNMLKGDEALKNLFKTEEKVEKKPDTGKIKQDKLPELVAKSNDLDDLIELEAKKVERSAILKLEKRKAGRIIKKGVGFDLGEKIKREIEE